MKRGSGSRLCSSAGEGSLSKGSMLHILRRRPPPEGQHNTDTLPLKLFPPSLPPTHGIRVRVGSDSLLLPVGRKEADACLLDARNHTYQVLDRICITTHNSPTANNGNTAFDGGLRYASSTVLSTSHESFHFMHTPPPQGLYYYCPFLDHTAEEWWSWDLNSGWFDFEAHALSHYTQLLVNNGTLI